MPRMSKIESVFWRGPAVSIAGYRRPTLTYPVHPAPASPPSPRDDPLAALVGATRADVLRALITGCGTMQLARELQNQPGDRFGARHRPARGRPGSHPAHRAGRPAHADPARNAAAQSRPRHVSGQQRAAGVPRAFEGREDRPSRR